jgi:ElaB/YqjD/DUF883 family membrane-anchored ribosome-binding protein
MWGRSKSPVEKTTDALSDTLRDVKVGAVKGAAGGALSTLGSKASDASKSVGNGDLGKSARKAAENAQKAAKKGAKQADVKGKADATGDALQGLGDRAGDALQNVQGNLDINDVPRLLRGLALLAVGFGTLFAPGSPLDASRRSSVDTEEIAGQARKGIDSAASTTQQTIKEIVDLTKEGISSLSDALTGGIEEAEDRATKALDETEKNLTKATGQAAKNTKDALPGQKKSGGSLRWLFFGLFIGGVAAFLSSPLSGPLGERVNNLRRDLGLGGDEVDDSQYWPSPPQETGGTTQGASAGGGDYSPNDLGKSETWNENTSPKE